MRDQLKEWVKDYCNDQFLDKDGNENIPAGVELIIDRALEHMGKEAGIKAESLGDHSITFDPADLPDHLIARLDPYRKVGFR